MYIYIYIFIYIFIYIGTRCVMGTKCAPLYAQIFKKIIQQNYIYHLIKEIRKLYLRHIDDIFLIWTGTLDESNKVIVNINKVYPSTKFAFSYSKDSVNFLDTIVKKLPGANFPSRYLKRKDCQAFLHRKSKQPESLKRSISYAQAGRPKQKCTEDCDFKDNCDILWKKLMDTGYKG